MASEKMDVSSTGDQGGKQVEAHTEVLFKGFRLILDQFLTLQEVSSAVLPEDIREKIEKVLVNDSGKRRSNGAVGTGTAAGGRTKGVWDYARTAALIDRALANGVEGITKKNGIVVQQGVKLNGIVTKAPHMEQGTNFMRSQAVDFKEDLAIDGPFDANKVAKPVENACKLDWFSLPKNIKLDFGKAEPYPGLKVDLGDPVKCGCDSGTAKAFNTRPMFYKVLEQLTVDLDRLGAFFSILVEDARAELKKDEDGMKTRMEPIVDDLDDVCSMQCNRIAALFYLMCQNSREVALQASGLRGFFKNWQRLAHASKTLFEPGKTNRMVLDVKSGKAKMPARRPPPGGGAGGYQGSGPKFQRGGGYGGAGGGYSAGGGYGGGYDRSY